MIDKSTRRGMPRTLSSLVNDPWGSITMVARRAERVHTSSYVHGREVWSKLLSRKGRRSSLRRMQQSPYLI